MWELPIVFFLTWMFLFSYFASKECRPYSCYVEMGKHVLGIGSSRDASQL